MCQYLKAAGSNAWYIKRRYAFGATKQGSNQERNQEEEEGGGPTASCLYENTPHVASKKKKQKQKQKTKNKKQTKEKESSIPVILNPSIHQILKPQASTKFQIS